MGYSASSHTIIGLRIAPASLFYEKQLVKVGKHDQPPEVRFDSSTGKPLWEEREVAIFDDDYGSKALKGNLRIYRPDFEGKNSPFVIIGVAVGADPDNDSYYKDKKRKAGDVPSPTEVEDIMLAIKELVPDYLWYEDQFGLWSMIHHSY